jgi:hypothetical protein
MAGYWGQTGRLDQLCTSRSVPMAPSRIPFCREWDFSCHSYRQEVSRHLGAARRLDDQPRLVNAVGDRLIRQAGNCLAQQLTDSGSQGFGAIHDQPNVWTSPKISPSVLAAASWLAPFRR